MDNKMLKNLLELAKKKGKKSASITVVSVGKKPMDEEKTELVDNPEEEMGEVCPECGQPIVEHVMDKMAMLKKLMKKG